MLVTRVYVCAYCSSPRVEFDERVQVTGFSTDDGSEICDSSYKEGADYCMDCESEVFLIPATLVLHRDNLYMLIKNQFIGEIRVLIVPHDVRARYILFTGRPKLLCIIAWNDITANLIDTVEKGGDAVEREHAFEALLNVVYNSDLSK